MLGQFHEAMRALSQQSFHYLELIYGRVVAQAINFVFVCQCGIDHNWWQLFGLLYFLGGLFAWLGFIFLHSFWEFVDHSQEVGFEVLIYDSRHEPPISFHIDICL